MSITAMLFLSIIFVGTWICGSAFVANYIERDNRHKTRAGYAVPEWSDSVWSIVAVVAWPIALPFFMPFKFARLGGAKAWNRIHRAELIQEELAGSVSRSGGGGNANRFRVAFYQKGAVMFQLNLEKGETVNFNQSTEIDSVTVTSA